MLLCSSRNINATYNLRDHGTFAKLVDFLCSKFSGIGPHNVGLSYKIPGLNSFTLQDDVDLQNLVTLARSFGLKHVCVLIDQHGGLDSVRAYGEQHNMQPNPVSGIIVNDQGESDNKVDLLPDFCPHNNKVLLTESWARGLTHVKQCFEGGAHEFQTILCKYAVQFGFNIRYIKNDSVRVTAVCSMVEDKGCTWSVHARVLKVNQFFYLRKWNSVHSCSVSVRTSNHPMVGSDMVADIMAAHVQDRPLTRPTDVVLDLKDDYGLDVNYRVAWLGVEKAGGNCLAPIPYRSTNCVGIVKPSCNTILGVMLTSITMNTTTGSAVFLFHSKHALIGFVIVVHYFSWTEPS
ncbi:hypothetical protein ACSBR1_033223 [Camellia fascicularis]